MNQSVSWHCYIIKQWNWKGKCQACNQNRNIWRQKWETSPNSSATKISTNNRPQHQARPMTKCWDKFLLKNRRCLFVQRWKWSSVALRVVNERYTHSIGRPLAVFLQAGYQQRMKFKKNRCISETGSFSETLIISRHSCQKYMCSPFLSSVRTVKQQMILLRKKNKSFPPFPLAIWQRPFVRYSYRDKMACNIDRAFFRCEIPDNQECQEP